jgi:hypothetical protein
MTSRPPASEAGAYPRFRHIRMVWGGRVERTGEPQARRSERAARRPASCGRPRALKLAACRFQARLAARFELHDLGGTLHRSRTRRKTYELEMHLGSSLSS